MSEGARHPATVAAWLTGCWRRRSITFADGREDDRSTVIWLQSASHYGDLRIPEGRIDLSHRSDLTDCSADELMALADQQASAGVCTLTDHRAVWQAGLQFHGHDAWPEPGDLRRIGPCLIEFAPSGEYVEDWRYQPGSPGELRSLELTDERDEGGLLKRRKGRWIQSGNHSMLLLDRTQPLPRMAPITDLVVEARADRAALVALLGMECSYAVRAHAGEPFVIEHSTLPFREGVALQEPVASGEGAYTQSDGASERSWHPI